MAKHARWIGLIMFLAQLSRGAADVPAPGVPAPSIEVAGWLTKAPAPEFNPSQTQAVVFLSSRAPHHAENLRSLLTLAQAYPDVAFSAIYLAGGAPPKIPPQQPGNLAIGDDRTQTAETRWLLANKLRAVPTAFLIKGGVVVWTGALSSLDAAIPFIPAPVLRADGGRFAEDDAVLVQEYKDLISANPSVWALDDTAREIRRRGLHREAGLFDFNPKTIRKLCSSSKNASVIEHMIRQAFELNLLPPDELHSLQAEVFFRQQNWTAAVNSQSRALELNPGHLLHSVALEHYTDKLSFGSALHLQVPRFAHGAAVVGTNAYILNGWRSYTSDNTIECFHANSRQTRFLDNHLHRRHFFGCAVHDEHIYLVGGYIRKQDHMGRLLTEDRFEKLDPRTGESELLQPLPVPVVRPGCVVADDHLYVIGGAPASLEMQALPHVQIYTFATGQWSKGAELPIPREGHAFYHDGKIYAPGGYSGRVAIRDFQVYDIAKDSWTQLPPLPDKTSSFQGAVLNRQLYLFSHFRELDRIVAYDFDTQTWSRLHLPCKPCRHAAALVLGNEIIISGGNVRSVPPYRSSIQRFSRNQLETAPRTPWTPP